MLRRADLLVRQAVIVRQRNGWLKPELSLTVRTLHMDVHPGLFSREKVKSKATIAENCWTHGRQLTRRRSVWHITIKSAPKPDAELRRNRWIWRWRFWHGPDFLGAACAFVAMYSRGPIIHVGWSGAFRGGAREDAPAAFCAQDGAGVSAMAGGVFALRQRLATDGGVEVAREGSVSRSRRTDGTGCQGRKRSRDGAAGGGGDPDAYSSWETASAL